MAVYHQMGHQSENLVKELEGYSGVVLSPVNAPFERMRMLLSEREATSYEYIFDPQLYLPRSERESLRAWDHFPEDVDTADLADLGWWQGVSEEILRVCSALGVDSVCSPAVIPNTFDTEFYETAVRIGNEMVVGNDSVEVLQSVVVRLGDLASCDWVMELASIVSGCKARRIYLVIVTETPPRNELTNSESLTGVLRLIAELRHAGLRPLIGFCGPEAILYTAAGASGCATGKFFNLRRFTSGRFQEPSGEGGGQLSYWFEEKLLAYLREADLRRCLRTFGDEMLSEASWRNPHGQSILQQLEDSPGDAWLASSWRHYMHWFADVDQRLRAGEVEAEGLLVTAEGAWQRMREGGVLMEEQSNDGSWVRPWRIALRQYPYDWGSR